MRLLPATAEDLGYLTELVRHPEVAPFLAPRSAERMREVFEARVTVGEPFGVFTIEADEGEKLGGVVLELGSAHSRICNLRMLMVDPGVRRSGVGTEAVRLACHRALAEHGLHRVQAESYGDNHAAHRVFERVGFVREGARRSAYWRHDAWVDGVLYGILAEEL